MRNITLIGMPAAGKSTIGVILAKTAGMNFIDTDLLIQKKEGALLQELINTKGNDYFKKVEEYVLRNIDAENTVISTGGSAIYYPEAIEHFKSTGKVVYLRATLKTIEERLDNITTRGITLGKGETIADLYNRRIPLYEKYADISVDVDRISVEEAVKRILEKFKL